MSKQKVCNHDCFNCVYEDCIADDPLTYDEIKLSDSFINMGGHTRTYDRDYYQKNREKILEKRKEYYKKNKGKLNAYGREWRKKNRESVNARFRRYYELNKEKEIERHRIYYMKNKKKCIERAMEYQKKKEEKRCCDNCNWQRTFDEHCVDFIKESGESCPYWKQKESVDIIATATA